MEQDAARLHEARWLDNSIPQVDATLRQAKESLFRLVLRTGQDTLEICAVVLRVACRTLTDLAKAHQGGESFA
ncbi:hypothetical protein ABZ924_20110 [Streptomyces sp. NPDC046876]|uniref:hypothetical protein n=1 Tax=Streptomyces sp. NPDC046876 TaxID=3155616 RepID=UPI0034106FBA